MISEQIINDLCSAYGNRNSSVINRLLGSYRTDEGTTYTFIISEYVAMELATAAGPAMIKSVVELFKRRLNPSMRRWMIKMLFVANLDTAGIQLQSQGGSLIDYPAAELVEYAKPPPCTAFDDQTRWLKPLDWNQPGFDMVHHSPNKVEFFRICSGQSQDVELEHFAKFLENLTNFNLKVSIVVVVPMNILKDFKIGTVTGRGCMSHFKGWDCSEEQFEILGMVGYP